MLCQLSYCPLGQGPEKEDSSGNPPTSGRRAVLYCFPWRTSWRCVPSSCASSRGQRPFGRRTSPAISTREFGFLETFGFAPGAAADRNRSRRPKLLAKRRHRRRHHVERARAERAVASRARGVVGSTRRGAHPRRLELSWSLGRPHAARYSARYRSSIEPASRRSRQWFRELAGDVLVTVPAPLRRSCVGAFDEVGRTRRDQMELPALRRQAAEYWEHGLPHECRPAP